MTEPVTPLVPTRPKSKSGGGGSLLMVLALLVASAGVAFAVGRMTAPQTPAAATATTGRNGFARGSFDPNASFAPGAFPGGAGRGGAVTLDGTVTAVSDGTITLKTAAGSETTVTTSGTTTYHAQAAATAGDIKVGSKVQVRMNGFGRGFGGPNASAAPSAAPGASGAPAVELTAQDVTIVP